MAFTFDNDAQSVFSYDGNCEPDAFNLAELVDAVSRHFAKPCQLRKLAQGGFRKVLLLNCW